MAERSWRIVPPDPPEHGLPDDLRARDAFGGRDVGWVNQMRPFVREFSAPGGTVFDPFCGFGTTLLAAALEQRAAWGLEVDPARAALARERLARHGVAAPVEVGALPAFVPTRPIDLVLTSVPYFGCRWPGEARPGQLYASDDYASHLAGLRAVFHALAQALPEGAHVVVMAENLVIGGRVLPLAWDLARWLGSLLDAREERLLCYERGPAVAAPGTDTDRSHEYALVFRKRRARLDTEAAAALLAELRSEGLAFELHGSYPAWRADPGARPPADLDLWITPAQAALDHWVASLQRRGFRLTLWGEPLVTRPDLATLRTHHYLRAERVDRDGGGLRLDLGLRPGD